MISRVRNSSEALAGVWKNAHEGQDEKAMAGFMKKVIIEEGLGIHDPSKEEIQRLLNADLTNGTVQLEYDLSDMVSRRALIGVRKGRKLLPIH